MFTIPGAIKRLARRYREAGHELYIVGGAVRDQLRGAAVSDYDFASSATPEETVALFRRTIPTGIRHGTVTVLFEGGQYEITTFRLDGAYNDHRHPQTVQFSRSLLEDLKRRDFTINSIAIDPLSGNFYDPFDGRADISRRVLRTVGPPEERFTEDALRMIRAVRFAATLGYEIEGNTAAAIRRHADTIHLVAPERIRQEFEKMITAPLPSTGWHLLDVLELLPHLLPELREDRTTDMQSRGGPAVFPHLLASCDCAPQSDSILRWAALLHDIGKPRCFAVDAAGIHFHGHDRVSAELAEAILTRLRFSNETIRRVTNLIAHHMFGYDSTWSDGAIRRLIGRVGQDQIFSLIALRRIDTCGKGGDATASRDLLELEHRIERILDEKPLFSVNDLAINGRDLINILSITPGPTIGIVLRELLQTALDDPEVNTPERLAEIARRFYTERIKSVEDSDPSPQRADTGEA